MSDDITPEPEETTPAPEATPPTVTPPEKAEDDLRGIVNDLAQKVSEMSDTLAQVINANGEHDSTPVKKPWTHWGGK